MSQKNKKKTYSNFHNNKKLQKKIINSNNFTYRELIKIMTPYLNQVNSILDIGCGVGTIDFYLASKGKKVTGIEISEEAVKIATENSKLFKLEKNLTFIESDFPSKIINQTFDLVILSEVIEHLENDVLALKAIHKLMKKNGILIITTPSRNAPLFRMGLLKNFDKEVGHLRRYCLEELINILEANKFNVEYSGKHEGVLRNFLFTNNTAGKIIRLVRGKVSNVVSFIDRLTIPLFGESNLHIIARKI